MRPLSYVRAADGAEAVAAAGNGEAVRYLGGGTNLVDLMKLGVEEPSALVDVTRAAVANAVYHATGARIRDLPITPAKLLHAL